jgi:hypothetical protein
MNSAKFEESNLRIKIRPIKPRSLCTRMCMYNCHIFLSLPNPSVHFVYSLHQVDHPVLDLISKPGVLSINIYISIKQFLQY